MLATAASDAANWGGAASSADSALAPDKTVVGTNHYTVLLDQNPEVASALRAFLATR